MKYKHRTPLLNIPVVGKGDSILPDMEMRKYRIIENMLLAGTGGTKEVVFDDGTYSLQADGDTYVVSVHAGGTFPSMHGLVGGHYFKATSKVAWEGLKRGKLHLLYVKATPSMPHDCTAVRLVSSTTKLGRGSLLMATADLRGDIADIDSSPPGKVYAEDVAAHVADNSNPHGSTLQQDELSVAKRLVLGDDVEVEVAGSSMPVAAFAAAAAEVGGRRVEVIDFVSGGTDGVVLKASKKVMYATIQRLSLSDSVGCIAVGYAGSDDNVDSSTEFAVYNDGEEGVPMKALVVCG